MKNRIKYYSLMLSITPAIGFCPIKGGHSNLSNTSIVNSKITLTEIFSNPSIPVYKNLFHTPTNQDAYSFLHTYLVQNNKTQYLPVLNDIVINSIQNGRITISTNIYSVTYEGQLTFSYSLQGKQDLSTAITNTTLFSSESESTWKVAPTSSQLFQRIKELNPSVDVNQLCCNVEDVVYTNGAYRLNVYAPDDSYYYTGTRTVTFQLNLTKETTLLGLKFKYNSTLAAPTVSGNKIQINADGFYAITDDGTGVIDRNITIPNGRKVEMSINGNVALQPTSSNAITLGNNAYLNLSTNANLTAIGNGAQNAAVYAGIRVPYSSEFVITGSNNGSLNVTGGTGYIAGPGIGGNGSNGDTPGPSNRTTSDLSCGTVRILGYLNADIKAGNSNMSDKGGASAGIGGGGCICGYAGSCKLVEINTNGTFICEGAGGTSGYCYSGPGPAIGGGGSGSYKGDDGGTTKMFVGGDLESIIIGSGNINCIQRQVAIIVGSSSAIGGGAGVGACDRKSVILNNRGGDLKSFKMTGGYLSVKGCNGNMSTISNKLSAIIGGGGGGSVNKGSDQVANSKDISGSLTSFEQTGGNIIIYNDSARTDTAIGSHTIGRGGCQSENNATQKTYGTTTKMIVDGGSIAYINGFGTGSFTKTPTNSKGQDLYPCFVPKTLNGASTINKTLMVESIGYSTNLCNLATYWADCPYSGVIWLPVGTYNNDINIDGVNFSATVKAAYTQSGTDNIVH